LGGIGLFSANVTYSQQSCNQILPGDAGDLKYGFAAELWCLLKDVMNLDMQIFCSFAGVWMDALQLWSPVVFEQHCKLGCLTHF